MGCMQDVDEKTMDPIQPRWSDCQCPECAVLLMPLKVAQSKLFVRCDDMTSGKERCTNGSGEEFEVNTDISKSSLKPMFASPIAAPNPQHNTATRGTHIFLHKQTSFKTHFRGLQNRCIQNIIFLNQAFVCFFSFWPCGFWRSRKTPVSPRCAWGQVCPP